MIFRVKFSGLRRTEALLEQAESRPPPARVRLHPRTYQLGLWPLTQTPKEAGPRTAISPEGGEHGRDSRRDAVGDQDRRCSRRDALEDPKNSLRPIGNVLSLMNVCSGVTNCPKRASSARPFVCQFRTSGSSPRAEAGGSSFPARRKRAGLPTNHSIFYEGAFRTEKKADGRMPRLANKDAQLCIPSIALDDPRPFTGTAAMRAGNRRRAYRPKRPADGRYVLPKSDQNA